MHFDLQKDTAKVKFMLEKRNIPSITAEVICVVDVSGSTQDMYRKGEMQEAIQRVVPVALNFDDNGELPVFTFCEKSYQIGNPMTAENYSSFVKKEIIEARIPKWGGTSYAPVLRDVLEELGFYRSSPEAPTSGFLNKLFGGNRSTVPASSLFTKHSKSNLPAIIYVFTDGENDDKTETSALLDECAKEGVEAYFNFIGIGHVRFSYLENIGNAFPNVGFSQIRDIVKTGGSDEIYDYLLPNELTDWLKAFVAQPSR